MFFSSSKSTFDLFMLSSPLLFLILQILKIFMFSKAGGCWERLNNPDLEREVPRGGAEGLAAGELEQQGGKPGGVYCAISGKRGEVARKKSLVSWTPCCSLLSSLPICLHTVYHMAS